MGQNTSRSPLAQTILIDYEDLLELLFEINQKFVSKMSQLI